MKILFLIIIFVVVIFKIIQLIKLKTNDSETTQITTTQVNPPINKRIDDKPNNPIVFLEITVNDRKIGKLIIELFEDVVPKTAENFKQLCLNKKLTYKNNIFHRIIPKFMAQGGDITNNDGTGGMSIYGSKFKDENFKLKHSVYGLLSMANSGPNTNSSQFFITFDACSWLDDKHVVFGRVIRNFDLLFYIEKLGTRDGVPLKKVVISDCGIVKK